MDQVFKKVSITYLSIAIVLLFAGLCAFSGCGINHAALGEFATPSPTFSMSEDTTPGPTSDPDSTPPISYEADALYEEFTNAFRDELLLINNYSLDFGYNNASDVTASIHRYILKAALLPELIDDACAAAKEYANELYPQSRVLVEEEIALPGWQYLSAILPFMEDGEDILKTLGLDITVENSGEEVAIGIRILPMPMDEFALEMAQLCDDPVAEANTYTDIRFTYAYTAAVYDKDGNLREDLYGNGHKYPNGYMDTLIWPLADYPDFVDTWAQGRSHNTRLHMGTDIKMPEGSAMYSCTDGVVIYTGTADIPGNYVIIMDDHGYEYHYYHLCEPTSWVVPGQTVTAGDRIGDVGNTGNSEVSHLHIALLAPDGEFINPFSLMSDIRIRDIG